MTIRILVLDAEREVRSIRDQLAPRGIDITCTADAELALRLWRTNRWNLVLAECAHSGSAEFIRAIRADSSLQRVAIHASAERTETESFLPVRKPYVADELIRALRMPVLPLEVSPQ